MELEKFGRIVVEVNPEKQGLKRWLRKQSRVNTYGCRSESRKTRIETSLSDGAWLTTTACCRSESRKTRIETRVQVHCPNPLIAVVEVNPEKQGLKPLTVSCCVKPCSSCRSESRKTRIETMPRRASGFSGRSGCRSESRKTRIETRRWRATTGRA